MFATPAREPPQLRTAILAGCIILVLLCVVLVVIIMPLWWWRRCSPSWKSSRPPSRPHVARVALASREPPALLPLQQFLLGATTAPTTVAVSADSDSWMASICVSVPSYRDPETRHTVLSALTNAARPERVVVAVCDQLDRASEAGIREQLTPLAQNDKMRTLIQHNVRVCTMDAADARGPILARYRIETELYQGEDFLFMVDSHTQFAPRWDEILLEDYATAPIQPAVLTTYAREYDRAHRDRVDFSGEPYHLSVRGFEAGSRFPLWDTVSPASVRRELGLSANALVPTFGWSANCALLPRAVVRKVPFHKGPAFPFLFFGEEVGMAMRLFTSGIPMFTPRRQAVVTLYEREYRPLFWDEVPDARGKAELKSQRRMQIILGMDSRWRGGLVGRGLLGSVFSVAQYEAFSGINMAAHTATAAAKAGVPQGDFRAETEWMLPDGEVLRS